MKKIRAEELFKFGEKMFVRLSSHHFDVLRIKEGERVKSLLPTGEFAEVLITNVEKKEGEVIKVIPPITPTDITAVIPLLKKGKTEKIVEFLSLIGVRKIVVALTERCEVKPQADKREKIIQRLRKIAWESSRISGVKPPDIDGIFPLRKIRISPHDSVKIVFWENSKKKLSTEEIMNWREKKVVFISGPEGGFSDREIRILKELGFHDFTVGDKILTAELFPIYIVSIFDFVLGEERR